MVLYYLTMEFKDAATIEKPPELSMNQKGQLSKAINGQRPTTKLPNQPKKLSPSHINRAIRDKEISELFLEGKTITEISVLKNLSMAVVSGAIRKFRNQLAEDNKATLPEHVEHSAASLNRLLSTLWAEYENSDSIKQRLPILSEIRRVQESIARIRGLITNKSVNIQLDEKKLHNFVDNFPDVVVDGQVRENVPQTSNGQHDHLSKPDYDESNHRALPDGSMVEVT